VGVVSLALGKLRWFFVFRVMPHFLNWAFVTGTYDPAWLTNFPISRTWKWLAIMRQRTSAACLLLSPSVKN